MQTTRAKIKAQLRRLAGLEGSPTSVALGGAIGIIVAWTPTIGLQMIIAASIAKACRANVPIATAMVWLSNPYTAVPLYWSNYLFGKWFVGGPEITQEWIRKAVSGPGPDAGFVDRLSTIYGALEEIALPLWIGSFAIGIMLAIPVYFALYARRKKMLLKKNQLVSQSAKIGA